ncbi:DUF4190 domain-containing protein [Plantibacter sp. Mn2098]|uniref:DUF4190 domain-containing protein n=1 Tax=Plantibacter sp. Mn2098 TaxID=3395266 RepID=UPI003BD716DF
MSDQQPTQAYVAPTSPVEPTAAASSAAPSYPAQPSFPTQPPAGWGPLPAPTNPHKTLSIVGFILSFFFLLNFAGLVVSIVAMVKSRRAGFGSGFALAGIIIGGLGVLLTLAVLAMAIPALIDGASTCAELGNGTHVIGDRVYTCTPGSFYVSSSW